MSSSSTTIQALAASLAELTFADLSQPTRQCALRCVLDLIGCAAAGRSDPVAGSVVRQGTRWAGATFASGRASVWFEDVPPLSALGAAFANSLAASILDVDDGHRGASGHPGAAVIPAVLAVGEVLGSRLQDVLLAIVCGYQAGVGVGSARVSSPVTTGATGRWAAVAVAAAVGRLRELSREQLAHAIALAETQAPNMAAADQAGFAGSHAKEGIPWAVLTGLAAVDQAALGFKGYLRGLDNPLIYSADLMTRVGFGTPLIKTTYFKPYASCRWTHAAIDAVLAMRDEGLDPSSIHRIEVASFRRALSLENCAQPADIIAAQFSIPFVVAVALLDGPEALLPMSAELLKREDILEIARRVVLILDVEFEARFPAQVPARVTMFAGNDVITREVGTPLGDPSNPLTDSQLIEKTVCLCSGFVDPAETRQFSRGWLSLASPDPLSELTAFIRGSRS